MTQVGSNFLVWDSFSLSPPHYPSSFVREAPTCVLSRSLCTLSLWCMCVCVWVCVCVCLCVCSLTLSLAHALSLFCARTLSPPLPPASCARKSTWAKTFSHVPLSREPIFSTQFMRETLLRDSLRVSLSPPLHPASCARKSTRASIFLSSPSLP